MEVPMEISVEVPVRAARPRRSIVAPTNQRYWASGNPNETATASGISSTVLDSPSCSDEELSYSSSDTEENVTDEEVDEEEFQKYLESRSPEEVKDALKSKDEQLMTRERLSKLGESNFHRDRNYEIESYFEAIQRPKYRKHTDTAKKTMTPGKTGSERGKKPRKGNRTGLTANERLPEKPEESFSVSKAIQNLDPNINGDWIVGLDQEKMMEQRREEIRQDFPEWMFLLREGFNIMLHGYGSKGNVFEDFRSFLNDEYLVIYFNGLVQKKLNARNFLIDFCRAVHRNVKISGNNMELIAEDVRRAIEAKPCARVFFIAKSLEHLANKNLPLFQVLSVLAQVKSIHLIGSCDHVNSFAGVSNSDMTAWNFWWMLCPTYTPYDEELSQLPGVFGQEQESTNAKSSLQHIFKSLTANAKKAFTVLADLQISALAASRDKGSKKKGATVSEGVPFRELVRRCQQNFIAHSDQTVKTLLVEFIDHKLINYTGKKGSMETLTITLDVDTLQEFLRSQK